MDEFPSIPGYSIIKLLGQGGMAHVYLAEQHALQRRVALKIISPTLAHDPEFSEQFRKESLTLGNLTHPKIIKVFDSNIHANCHYIAMEYLSGGTLRDKIKQGMDLPQSLQVLKDMLDALAYAHSQGLVHRDIKAQNILLYPDGTPVLSDFGIAKLLASDGATLSHTDGFSIGRSTYGSPAYMSPEQVRGQTVDNRADYYALGILFYEMLVGELPYQAADQFAVAIKQLNDPIPVLPSQWALFQPILDKTLAKDRHDRVANAQELLTLITRLEAAYQAHQNKWQTAGSWQLQPKFYLLVVIVMLGVGLAAYYYAYPYQRAPIAANIHRSIDNLATPPALSNIDKSSETVAPSDVNQPTTVTKTSENAWWQIQESQNPSDYAAYLEKFPDSKYASLAAFRKEKFETQRLQNQLALLKELIDSVSVKLSALGAPVGRLIQPLASKAKPAVRPSPPPSQQSQSGIHADRPTVAAQQTARQAKAVTSLLSKAYTAFERKALTTPDDNNAVKWSEAVLVLEPTNTAANGLLREVINTYLLWSERNTKKGRLNRASLYLQRAQSISQYATENQQQKLAALNQDIDAQRARAKLNTSQSRKSRRTSRHSAQAPALLRQIDRQMRRLGTEIDKTFGTYGRRNVRRDSLGGHTRK